MVEWNEKPPGRLTVHIFKLFNDYAQKYHVNDFNGLIGLRAAVLQSFLGFLNEPAVKKRYGSPVDSLSLVSFSEHDACLNPDGPWIPISVIEDSKRPAGITNEEFRDFIERIDAHFKRHELDGSLLRQDIVNLFHEAFFKPSSNRPFQKGTYVRFSYATGESAFSKSQNIPCEICGENRVIDECHIIPRVINGHGRLGNILFLCPSHHRLFDRCMLSKEEWDKIDWSRKDPPSQTYVEKVIKVAHLSFWKEIESGIYRRYSSVEEEAPNDQ